MSFDRRLRALCASALTGLMLAAAASSRRAQTTSASVSGTVQDAQGGVLPGVAVTLTSRTQGNTATAVTDAEGRFVFAIVRPDTYTLTAELQGFKKLERTNLVVNANDRLSAGILALEVGAMTEEVTVSSRVSELQTTSGERSFTLENAALHEHRQQRPRRCSTSPRSCPARCRRATAGGEIGSVSGFTVNGQRAELEQHDDRRRRQHRHRRQRRQHGDDQHRRRRRVQGADQLLPGRVRPRGRRPGPGGDQERLAGLPRLRLLVRPPVRLERQHWTNKRDDARDAEGQDHRATTAATPSAARSSSPASTRTRRSCSSSSARSTSAGSRTTPSRADARARPRSSAAATSRRAWTTAATRSPTSATTRPGLPCSAADTRGCFQDGGVLGRIPANRLYAPGLAVLEHLPGRRTSPALGAGLNFTSQDAEQHAAP